MRRWFALAAIFILALPVIAAPCNTSRPVPVSAERSSTVDSVGERVETHENLCVDVGVNGDGYYALVSDAEIRYGEDGIESLYLDEPTLLAFQVSSEYSGGIWRLDWDRGEQLLSELTEIKQALHASGDGKLLERIETVIGILESSGPMSRAST